ncbi:thioredoxin-like protein [Hymenopellis radicata]|nr:thioredoxin-like protein [Hymenopellis radicata]
MSTSLARRALTTASRSNGLRMFHATSRAQDHYLDADFVTFKKVTTGPGSEGRVQLVDFYAEWCGPCKMLTPLLKDITKDPKTNYLLTGALKPVDLVTINTESEDGQDLSRRYNIAALPTVMGFVGGKHKAFFTGALNRQQIHDFLKSL